MTKQEWKNDFMRALSDMGVGISDAEAEVQYNLRGPGGERLQLDPGPAATDYYKKVVLKQRD